MLDEPRHRHVVPVDPDTFTDCMAWLSVGYAASVAATAGCLIEIRRIDRFGADVMFVRKDPGGGEEATVCAQLKATTQITVSTPKPSFGYRFHEREHLNRLTLSRTKGPKHILVVMLAPREQALWTAAGRDRLEVFHCCYWVNLEGMAFDPDVRQPTVRVPKDNMFNADALTGILDRLERGEPL